MKIDPAQQAARIKLWLLTLKVSGEISQAGLNDCLLTLLRPFELRGALRQH